MLDVSSTNKTPVQRKRNRRTAILLAVFLGPWTWIYTFCKDARKAAVALGLNFSILILIVLILIREGNSLSELPEGTFYDNGMWIVFQLFMLLVVMFGTWLWSVLDTVFSREGSYILAPEEKNKTVAVLLAILLGPWTWLYTYNRDYWKFWVSIAIGGVGLIILSLVEATGFMDSNYLIIAAMIIWVVSIIYAAIRPSAFYQSLSQV